MFNQKRNSCILRNKVTKRKPEQIWGEVILKKIEFRALIPTFDIKLDIVRLIEKLALVEFLQYEIVPTKEMPNEYALTIPSSKKIFIREDTYNKACEGNPKARFTLAHELGHICLHQNEESTYAHSQVRSSHHYTLDAEWQADEFAAWLLVDFSNIEKVSTPQKIVTNFGVDNITAFNLWITFKEQGLF